MGLRSFLTIGAAALSLSACVGVEDLARKDMLGELPAGPRNYTVTYFGVEAPETLKVSEANLYYPVADIVWRGEPYGDRYDQVEDIFTEAALRGTDGLRGPRFVRVAVQVVRFHAITEKARAAGVGGMHSIRFLLTVYDSKSGALLEGPRWVEADFPALTGETALAAEREGQTQRVRIVAHLAQVLRDELSNPVPVPLPGVPQG